MFYNKINLSSMPTTRVATFTAFGTDPETEAWAIMATWVVERINMGLLSPDSFRCFGYVSKHANENGEYGYKVMVTIPDNVHVSDVIKEEVIPEGFYLTLRTEFNDDALTEGWSRLIGYARSKNISLSPNHVPLEENVSESDGTKYFVLHLPITSAVQS